MWSFRQQDFAGRMPCQTAPFPLFRCCVQMSLPQSGTKQTPSKHRRHSFCHIVPAPILHGDEPPGVHGRSRFLEHFLFGVGCDRVIHIAPTAGQRPCAAMPVHRQNLSVDEHGSSCVHLRSLLSRFIAEKIPQLFGRHVGAQRQHFCRDLTQCRLPFFVIDILSVLQARLCNALHADRKVYPGIVHTNTSTV